MDVPYSRHWLMFEDPERERIFQLKKYFAIRRILILIPVIICGSTAVYLLAFITDKAQLSAFLLPLLVTIMILITINLVAILTLIYEICAVCIRTARHKSLPIPQQEPEHSTPVSLPHGLQDPSPRESQLERLVERRKITTLRILGSILVALLGSVTIYLLFIRGNWEYFEDTYLLIVALYLLIALIPLTAFSIFLCCHQLCHLCNLQLQIGDKRDTGQAAN